MSEPPGSLSAVTVVFEAEVPLLELQARSVARHVQDGVFDEVMVIDNTREGCRRESRQRIRAELGSHADLHHVHHANRPPRRCASGRGVALAADPQADGCGTPQTDRYVVLDAKNHFIARTTRADFFDASHGPSPRRDPLVRAASAPTTARAVAPGSGSTRRRGQRFTATAPPVVLDRRVVDAIVADIGGGDPDRFPVKFDRAGYTEFFLYSGLADREGCDARRPGVGSRPS